MLFIEKQPQPPPGLRVLVVESNLQVRQELTRRLRQQKAKIALVKSNAEAFEILRDAHFLEFDFDALIINEQLNDGPSWGFVENFRKWHPEQPVVLVSNTPNLAVKIWSRAYNVRLVAKAKPKEALHAVNGKGFSLGTRRLWKLSTFLFQRISA